ncbi:hypothetical protein J6590_025528 [Homalodisca vitripennis]|nr:hypothetical protein J6590_025528 [Homalodisca vitripennis]
MGLESILFVRWGRINICSGLASCAVTTPGLGSKQPLDMFEPDCEIQPSDRKFFTERYINRDTKWSQPELETVHDSELQHKLTNHNGKLRHSKIERSEYHLWSERGQVANIRALTSNGKIEYRVE